MNLRMADTGKKVDKKETHEREESLIEQKIEKLAELEKEAIKVGVEAGEIVSETAEGAELTTGEVTEEEKKSKEGYAGGGIAGATTKTTTTKVIPFPTAKIMKAQVKQELKKEIKGLQKKVKKVMNQGPGKFEPHSINVLLARLRRLTEILYNLAYLTGDFIKDLWVKYVRDEQTKKT